MLKNFLALYGAMRLLEDSSRPVPPDDNDENNSLGCGCWAAIIIAIVIVIFAL